MGRIVVGELVDREAPEMIEEIKKMKKNLGGEGMKRTEILIGGVGGQGVILAGILLGSAATLFDHKKAVQTQAYSSEQRGGMARAEVILSERTGHRSPGPQAGHSHRPGRGCDQPAPQQGQAGRAGLVMDSDLVQECQTGRLSRFCRSRPPALPKRKWATSSWPT